MSIGNRPINSMRNRNRSARHKGIAGDRRSRLRFRELCDEVLASYRVAAGRELFSEADRAEARSMLARLTPVASARSA
jgi:hypothetical protein